MEECHQVTIAGQAVEATGLEGVDLVSVAEADEAALGGDGAVKKESRRVND